MNWVNDLSNMVIEEHGARTALKVKESTVSNSILIQQIVRQTPKRQNAKRQRPPQITRFCFGWELISQQKAINIDDFDVSFFSAIYLTYVYVCVCVCMCIQCGFESFNSSIK